MRKVDVVLKETLAERGLERETTWHLSASDSSIKTQGIRQTDQEAEGQVREAASFPGVSRTKSHHERKTGPTCSPERPSLRGGGPDSGHRDSPGWGPGSQAAYFLLKKTHTTHSKTELLLVFDIPATTLETRSLFQSSDYQLEYHRRWVPWGRIVRQAAGSWVAPAVSI